MDQDNAVTSDLARLRERFPGWFFTACWVAAGSGPDRRMLIAQRGVTLAGFTAEELSEKISREGAEPEPYCTGACNPIEGPKRPYSGTTGKEYAGPPTQ